MSASAFAQEQTDSLVRLMSAQMIEQYEKDGQQFRKVVGPARFLHNNTYLICDTAIQDVNRKVINAWGHVQLLQDETVLTSEKLDYLIDDDLAQFRGSVVQLQDKDGNILRTRYLDYNTKDSLAVFSRGGAMQSKDGQLIESDEGTYDSKAKLFNFTGSVDMYTDSLFVKTSKLNYYSKLNKVFFDAPIDVWKDGGILSSETGWYDRNDEVFFFHVNVHLQNQDQEGWADSLFFYRNKMDIEMFGKSQMRDTTRNIVGMSEYLFYSDSLSSLNLRRDAAIMAINVQDEKRDTVYFGADTLLYYTLPRCDVDSIAVVEAGDRLAAINTDPVTEYRQKAYKEAQEKKRQAQAEADKKAGLDNVKKDDKDAAEAAAVPRRRRRSQTENPPEAQKDTSVFTPPAVPAVQDSLSVSDSLHLSDSLTLSDSLAVSDSVALADSLSMVQKDTTKIGFMTALGHVKIWREDIQVACDSLYYTDLDSLARFFKNPVIWNDLNRQYSADSITVLIQNQQVRKASLMSNAFVAIKQDEDLYDQIKGAEILAFFDSTMVLTRFDGLGDPQAMFYLQENDAFATVNKVSAKMMSGYFKDGTIETVFYFDAPDNNAYPVVQLPKADKYLKGFKWEPDRRPGGREDVLTQEIKASERKKYDKISYPMFRETLVYFPGAMSDKYRLMEQYRKPKQKKQAVQNQPADPFSVPDTGIPVFPDSLALSDTLAKLDSIARDAFVTTSDSLAVSVPSDSVSVQLDSLTAPVAQEPAPLSKKELKAIEKARKQAEREAKWARLDSLDAVKAAKKEQKRLEKQRKKTYRKLLQNQKEAAREDALLQKYIENYRRKKAKQEARLEAKRQAAKKESLLLSGE